ncbi:MAG: addiction module protein [Nitrospirales bacterium]|nr:addiction module protein [Nitrospirales bacterium]
MKDILAIKQLSRKEKLQVMEAIWEDLSQEDHLVESPAWHESQLRDTEQKVQSGIEQTLDWQEAKKELRKRFE